MQIDWSDSSDAELIRAAGTTASAFGVLYERHALQVYSWSRRRLEWAASDLTAETFAQAWLVRHRFRDEHDGSALPWLLGIARNVLRETVRLDRVETRARERLGLPVDLAAEDGYAKVDERLSPVSRSRPRSTISPNMNARPSSCAWSANCPTTRSPSSSRSGRRRHDSASPAPCGASRS